MTHFIIGTNGPNEVVITELYHQYILKSNQKLNIFKFRPSLKHVKS